MELNGRQALIIGAGSGVGRGIAQALARAGMHVIAADLDEENARQTCESLTDTSSSQAAFVDATDRASLEQLAQSTLPDGVLDLLVVTVGAIDLLPITEIDEAHWYWAWNVNVMTSIRAVQTFLPLLKRGKPSAIVLTGSGAGLQIPEPDPLSGVYSTTKHALTGYASVLRAALATEGIHVLLLVPSGVEGNLAVTSACSRATHLGMGAGEVRGQQPTGRILMPASQIGELLVQGLREDRAYVNNRGPDFHEAMLDWLAEWKTDTTQN